MMSSSHPITYEAEAEAEEAEAEEAVAAEPDEAAAVRDAAGLLLPFFFIFNKKKRK